MKRILQLLFANCPLLRAVMVPITTLFGLVVHSQAVSLDTSALRGFDAGVISKVCAIAKYTPLSSTQQTYLANYYRRTDSIVKAWVFQGQPIARIDSIQERASHLFYDLEGITAAQRREFGEKQAEHFVQIASQGEMDYIRQEYHPGSTEEEVYRQWIRAKYNAIYQQYLRGKEEAAGIQSAAREQELYQFYPALYAGRYIGQYLQRLDSIRKIPDTTSRQIRVAFLNAIRKDQYGDWSRMLLDITRYLLPDTALFSRLYRTALLREATAGSAADKYNLIQVQHVSYAGFQGIYQLVLEKNYANVLLQLTHGNFRPYLLDSLVEKNARYYDSLIQAALLRDGSLLSGNQFAVALKYREVLHINPGLVDSLLYHALYLSQKLDSLRRKDPFYYTDFSDYESRVLSSLLTDEQYNNLLTIKNTPNAYAEAGKNWEDMMRRGLCQGLNKEETVAAITRFYVARYNAWNRLAHDSKRQMANLRALDEVKPNTLKLLEAARWNTGSEKQDNNAKLLW